MPRLFFRRTWIDAIALMAALFGVPDHASCAEKEVAAKAGQVVLIRDGKAACVVIVSQELFQDTGQWGQEQEHKVPHPFADLAIEELQKHLRYVTSEGVTVSRVEPGQMREAAERETKAGKTVLLLNGPKSDPAAAQAIGERGKDPESFLLDVHGALVSVTGLSPKGTLNGVFEVLEQVGFRWFLPGELGLVVPEGKTLSLREQRLIAVPSFRSRQLAGAVTTSFPEWTRHMRNSVFSIPGNHGITPFTGKSAMTLFTQHPEYFALIDGRRQKRQVCVSNPDVLRLATESAAKYFRENPSAEFIGMGPNDGGGFCECDKCRALDGGDRAALSNNGSVTDRYIWFYNHLLKGIEHEFPDKKIGTLIYNNYINPPVKMQPDPRIVGRLALIHVCRIHSPLNPICPEGHYYQWVSDGWQKKGVSLYNSGYWFNLADPGLLFIMVSRIRDEIPLAHKLGHIGFARSTGVHWASETPSLYIAAKLMWDHTADVDLLMQDFYTKFYGPAAGPMQQYTTMLDKALVDCDYHTGRCWDTPFIYPTAMRVRGHRLLDDANRLAGNTIYGRRVTLARQALEYLDAFVDMIESRNRVDFVAAKASLDRAYAVQKQLTEGYDIPMLRTLPRSVSAQHFLEMFYAKMTLEGYSRVTGDNQLVAGLSDTWQFLLDPQSTGERMGLQSPAIRGGNWQLIKSSLSWGDQGFRYYFGDAWYRQKLKIPAETRGRKIMLWFGGVDDAARVWVNGQLVGTSPGAVFDLDAHGGSVQPFELDATDAIRFGEDNTVTVRASRNKANELGSGGIIGPVMFYAAAPAQQAGRK